MTSSLKKIYFSLGFLLAGSMTCFAQNALRIDLSSRFAILQVKADNSSREYIHRANSTWYPRELQPMNMYLSGNTDTSMSWKKLTIKVAVSHKDQVRFLLMSHHSNPDNITLYDNIAVDGRLLPNGGFEEGTQGFVFGSQGKRKAFIVNDPGLVKHGANCAAGLHNIPVGFTVTLTPDEEHIITLDYCVIPSPAFDKQEYAADFRNFMNMGFSDEQAGDGVGGWTDQGPDNDLSGFLTARQWFGGVHFKIVDPAENAGNSVAVFNRDTLKKQVKEVAFSAPKPYRFLYLLHSGAWLAEPHRKIPIAEIVIATASGKETVIPIVTQQDVCDWWLAHDMPNGRIVYRRGGNQKFAGIQLSKFKLPSDMTGPVRIRSTGKGVYMLLGATYSDKDVQLYQKDFTPGKDFKAADISGVCTIPGSPLDMSRFVTGLGGVAVLGEVRINAAGRFEYKNMPEIPVRFTACYHSPRPSTWCGPESIEEKKAAIDQYIGEAVRRGYNMIRTHIIDVMMMGKSTEDFKPDPQMLDLADYLLFKAEKSGIYINYNTGAYQLSSSARDYACRILKQNMLLGDPKTRKAWLEMTRYMLFRKNSYTGCRMVDSPALVCVEPYNELGLAMMVWHGEVAKTATEKFQLFLNRKYGKNAPTAHVPPFRLGEKLNDDWNEFFYMLALETNQWMNSRMRELGYHGPVGEFNCVRGLMYNSIRQKCNDLNLANTYFCHPSSGEQPGQLTPQDSLTGAVASYVHSTAAMRLANRPLIVTEYNHASVNRSKHEHLIFPAYAAYQDYAGLTLHATNLKELVPSTTMVSLNDRANELLALFLFRRGDVAPYRHRVILEMPEKFITDGKNGNMAVSANQSKVALVNGFAVKVTDNKSRSSDTMSELHIPLAGSDQIKTEQWYVSVKERKGNFKLEDFVKKLRKCGFLPEDNISDPKNGIYQTDTGELTLHASSHTFTVKTPRTEAIAAPAQSMISLQTLRNVNSSIPACIAITTLDDTKTLADSSHFLLFYLVQEANTGEIRSNDYSILHKQGTLPVLLQTGVFSGDLELKKNREYQVYPISINGKRRKSFTIRTDALGRAAFRIDTSKLAHGPTFYFEIIEKK